MTRRQTSGASVGTRLLGLGLEMPPAIYVAITGEVPGWVRIWFVAWVSLWALMTVISAATYQAKKNTT